MTRKMPAQKPGKSKQDYRTPRVFLDAVERKFGTITIDLASKREDRVVAAYISPMRDSLKVRWKVPTGVGWLNPPFDNIGLWSRKCCVESLDLLDQNAIVMLTPASIGSDWFDKYVWGRARVYALKGRITFVGETAGYPKDLMISLYTRVPPKENRLEIWDWRNDV